MKYQQGIPLDYVSGLWDPYIIVKISKNHEDKEKTVDMIPKRSWYHLMSIAEATMKLYLEYMLLRGNQRSESWHSMYLYLKISGQRGPTWMGTAPNN